MKGEEGMSVESAKAFLERMKSDSAFRESVVGAQDDAERNKLVVEAGFEFTKEEIDQARSEFQGELSDEDLRLVAGGTCRGAGVPPPLCGVAVPERDERACGVAMEPDSGGPCSRTY